MLPSLNFRNLFKTKVDAYLTLSKPWLAIGINHYIEVPAFAGVLKERGRAEFVSCQTVAVPLLETAAFVFDLLTLSALRSGNGTSSRHIKHLRSEPIATACQHDALWSLGYFAGTGEAPVFSSKGNDVSSRRDHCRKARRHLESEAKRHL
ncbi:hypothetical protein EGJ52_24310 [Pseudomonas luteola]|nr:hypothetical protein EGJ52_24310 [Pseudomonas luteola]